MGEWAEWESERRAGGWVDQHAAFLIGRGIKTLDLRVRRQNETAMKLAVVLEAHPKVCGKSVSGRAESLGQPCRKKGDLFWGLCGGCEAGFGFSIRPSSQ